MLRLEQQKEYEELEKKYFEIERIKCDECSIVLYAEFIDCDETIHGRTFSQLYSTTDGTFCNLCVGICDQCKYYNNGKYHHCLECQKNMYNGKLIKTTYNNITKELPVELVDEILFYVVFIR